MSKYPLITSTSILLLLVGSMAVPFQAFALDVDPSVPPGLTRITIIHDFDGTRTEIDHGQGAKLPPRPHVSPSCLNEGDNGTTECDVNTWRGWSWPNTPVEYYVNLDGADGISGDVLQAIIDGGQTWEDANSSFDQSFKQTTHDPASGADKRKTDNQNTIDFGRTNKFGNNVIAVTVFWINSSGNFVEADMRFNNNLPWTVNNISGDPDDLTGDSAFYDVQNIVTHEFGHFYAGLEDIPDSAASKITMYAFGAKGEVQKRSLAVSDVNSFARAYGPANDAPVVEINKPTGTTFASDAVIQFNGTADDLEDGDISTDLNWVSNLDGAIGSVATFSRTLSEGTHTITASATDSDGRIGSDSIIITVGDTPTSTNSSLGPIGYDVNGGPHGDKHLLVTIILKGNLNDEPISDASVSIGIHKEGSAIGWTGTGTTDIEGEVTFQLSNARNGFYTTDVTAVASDPTWDGDSAPDDGFLKE